MISKSTLAAAISIAAVATSYTSDAQTLSLELVQGGFASPVYATAPKGDLDRLFVVQRNGVIRVMRNGSLNGTPFLNISGIVNSGGERGLLGLAFHPDFFTNGRFFVNYTQTSSGGPGGNGDTVIAEYKVTGDPLTNDVADPTQVQVITWIDQPFSNHNAGGIDFGPDGKLYVPMGDGGSGNDPLNAGQDPSQRLGKILRYDVDIASPFIPADNPYVGVVGTDDAIWAFGMRNPWRWSFDRDTGDLYIGDVGQGAREEVNFVPASSTGGENYGWRCMEGNNCTGLSGCVCNAVTLTDPVVDYNHGGGRCSITGGYVYRGTEIPGLAGPYFYGDFCSSQYWSFRMVGGSVTEFTERTSEFSGAFGPSSFGEDGAGELYVVTLSGSVYKVVQDCGFQVYCVANTNSSGLPASIFATGSAVVTDEDLTLTATSVAPNQFGYFLMSTTQGFIPNFAGSQGNFCLGSPFIRFAADIANSGPGGVLTLSPDFGNLPNNAVFMAGDTWNFQAWFRDQIPATTSNTSDGVSVSFCP